MGILEVVIGILGLVTTFLVYILQGQRNRMDRLEKELKAHEVSDASTLITRVETDSKMVTLKEDIRKIISPLSESIIRIEGLLLKRPV